MSYGFTIFLKDLASSTLMKVSSGISNMESRLQSNQSKIQNNFRNTTKSIDELNAKLQRLNAQRTASTSINDIRRLKTEALQVEREIKRLEDLPPKGFGERLRSLGGQFGELIGLAGGVGLALQGWESIKAIFNKGIELEQSNIKFEVLLGSVEKAKTMLSDLTQYAEKTPYSFDGLQKGAETMLGFGIAEEKIIPNMKMLGDIAMGSDEKLQGLSLVYSQIMATGKLMGQDLLQLINQGFNPLQIISEQTGLSVGDLKKKMEEGAISSQMIEEAFRLATSEGGRFYGMSQRMSESAGGKFSTMMDAFSAVIGKIGLRFAEWVKPLFEVGTAFAEKLIPFGQWVLGFLPSIETFNTILTILGITALTVGTYMLIANASAIAWSVTLGILEGIIWLVEAAQWAWNLAMSMNPIGLVVAGIVAFIGILVLCWNKFDGLRGAVMGVWEVLKGLGTMIKNYVITRFNELLAGIKGIGSAIVAFLSGDFEGAIQKAQQAGKNLIGASSAKQAFEDGKKAFQSFNTGWDKGVKMKPVRIDNISKINQKAQKTATGGGKSEIFNSLLNDTGDEKKKKGKKKNPAKDKANGITAGGSRQTNIVVNIGKLQDQTVIQVDNTEKGLNNLSEKVQELLLRAVNSVNQMQSSQ